jgi:hypothetical protein
VRVVVLSQYFSRAPHIAPIGRSVCLRLSGASP